MGLDQRGVFHFEAISSQNGKQKNKTKKTGLGTK